MATVLTEGSVGKRLAAFTLPLLASNVLQQLYSAADAAIVGQVSGGDSLAAVGASNPILSFLIAIMVGLGAGSEIIIARKIGQKDPAGAKETLDSMLTTILALAAVITVIGFFGAEFLLRLIGTPEDILGQSVLYLQYYFLGMVGVAGYNTLSGLIRSTGNAVVPLVLLLISAVMNIVLDLLFVWGFQMGVAGAAVATVVSQAFSFLCCLFYVNLKKNMIGYHPFHLKLRLEAVREGFACGIPCSVQQCANSIGMIVLQIAVNSLGTQVITAYTVGSKIDSFAGLPLMGIGQALCIFTSQNMGANQPERIQKAKRLSLLWGYGFSLLLLLLFWFFGEEICTLFCREEEAVRMAADYIRILSLAYFFAGYWVVIHGFIRGTGNTVAPMIITLIGNWGARLPLAFILKPYFGERGVWMSIPLGWALAFLLTALFVKSRYFQEKYRNGLRGKEEN